jgi:predicted transposase/invertase (TIGR01784 family)
VKTDILFAELFQEFPQIFFDLIDKPETNADIYQFTSPELKQRSFRLDGVLTTTDEFADEPIYFVEIQFYKDEEFYDRFFSEIFLYLSQYQPVNSSWYAVVIYASPSNESAIPSRYQTLVAPHLRRFFLNELKDAQDESLERGIVRLIVESEKKTASLARELIGRVEVELKGEIKERQLKEFIETIVIYKFPSLSREEIETMLNLSLLKETRVYQEAKEEGKLEGILEGKLEGKLEIVPKLRQKGLTIQEIADLLELDLETVRQVTQQQ